MSISNCASAGADSRAAPITGIVTRKDPATGQESLASVRPNGVPSPPQPGAVSGATLSSATLSALLGAQEVA